MSEATEAVAEAPEATGKVKDILDLVSELTLLEAAELVKAFETKFGVSAAPVAMAAPAAGDAGGAAAEEEDEQTEFTVVLKEIGAQKLQVIKIVRKHTSLGLKEAKALVDGAPQSVLELAPKDKAEEVKAELEEVGATVELK